VEKAVVALNRVANAVIQSVDWMAVMVIPLEDTVVLKAVLSMASVVAGLTKLA
jgi:hypothetical protein